MTLRFLKKFNILQLLNCPQKVFFFFFFDKRREAFVMCQAKIFISARMSRPGAGGVLAGRPLGGWAAGVGWVIKLSGHFSNLSRS